MNVLSNALAEMLALSNCRSGAEKLPERFILSGRDIRSIGHSGANELMKYYGASRRTADLLTALPSLVRATYRENYTKREKLDTFDKQAGYMSALLYERINEHIYVALLDERKRLITSKLVSEGTVDNAALYPREIVKAAAECGASSVVMAHNHPSGSAVPTEEDIRSTEAVSKALSDAGFLLEEHIIVGKTSAFGIMSGTLFELCRQKYVIR